MAAVLLILAAGRLFVGRVVFDHRNASLRKWLLDEYIGGKTGMGHPDVSGMFLDDQWDPVLGPSEFVCGGKKPCDPRELPSQRLIPPSVNADRSECYGFWLVGPTHRHSSRYGP